MWVDNSFKRFSYKVEQKDGQWLVWDVRLKGNFRKMKNTWTWEKTFVCGCKACIWEKWGEKESSVAISSSSNHSGALICLSCFHFSLSFFFFFVNLWPPWPALQMLFKGEMREMKRILHYLPVHSILPPLLITLFYSLSLVLSHSYCWSRCRLKKPKDCCSSSNITTKSWLWALPGLPLTILRGFF